MLLVAPNWLGVTENVIERAKVLARDRYVAFVADMFGEGKGPKGTENPMEFLAPLINDAAETRRRISAALQAMSKEGNDRGWMACRVTVLQSESRPVLLCMGLF